MNALAVAPRFAEGQQLDIDRLIVDVVAARVLPSGLASRREIEIRRAAHRRHEVVDGRTAAVVSAALELQRLEVEANAHVRMCRLCLSRPPQACTRFRRVRREIDDAQRGYDRQFRRLLGGG